MSRPVGFYKDKKGTTRPVTKPITKKKARKTRVALLTMEKEDGAGVKSNKF